MRSTKNEDKMSC